MRLAPSVTAHLKRGGTLVLSGIIESRLDMVLDAFSAQGLKLEKQLKEGEWFALSFKL